MLTLTGKILNIVQSQNTNRATGEIRQRYTAEILHTVRGRSEIVNLNLDQAASLEWQKAVGHDISVEVRSYAIKTEDGGLMEGFALADKTALPTIHKALKAA